MTKSTCAAESTLPHRPERPRRALSGLLLRDGTDAIRSVACRLAEKLDPGSLDAGMMLRRLGRREERLDGRLEATAQGGVSDVVTGERFVGGAGYTYTGSPRNSP